MEIEVLVPDVHSDLVCNIGLTLIDAKAILESLSRTMCKGNALTISMELEDELCAIINNIKTK